MKEELMKLGYIFDKKNEAEELIDFYEDVLSTIEEKVSQIEESEKPRVYLEFPTAYKSVCTDVSWHQTCVMAGGINIAADLCDGYGFPEVDPEWVMEQNPDVIIRTGTGGYSTDDPSKMIDKRNEILNRPELVNVAAVKDGRVYIAHYYGVGSFPDYIIFTAYMAKWFHPELFEDLDPQAIHQEYLTEFQGLDYDLNEHGVFVYPEP